MLRGETAGEVRVEAQVDAVAQSVLRRFSQSLLEAPAHPVGVEVHRDVIVDVPLIEQTRPRL